MFGAKRQWLGTVYTPTHRKERDGWAPDRLWRFVDENKQLQLQKQLRGFFASLRMTESLSDRF